MTEPLHVPRRAPRSGANPAKRSTRGAKIVICTAAVAATLGGWAAFAVNERPTSAATSHPAGAVVSTQQQGPLLVTNLTSPR
jgi:hypothetical protein